MPVKTNHVYAALAYKKAVLQETIALLKRQYMGAGGADPQQQITCEDVFSIDSIVPPEVVQEFVQDLMDQKHQVELEMNQYEFNRKMNGQHQAHGTHQRLTTNTKLAKQTPTKSGTGPKA